MTPMPANVFFSSPGSFGAPVTMGRSSRSEELFIRPENCVLVPYPHADSAHDDVRRCYLRPSFVAGLFPPELNAANTSSCFAGLQTSRGGPARGLVHLAVHSVRKACPRGLPATNRFRRRNPRRRRAALSDFLAPAPHFPRVGVSCMSAQKPRGAAFTRQPPHSRNLCGPLTAPESAPALVSLYPCRRSFETSPSSPTSTTARRRSSTGSCSSRAPSATTSASPSGSWIRTTSSASAASPSSPRRPRSCGRTCASTSSTRPATPISAARSSGSCRWSTARSCSSTPPKGRCRRRSSSSARR